MNKPVARFVCDYCKQTSIKRKDMIGRRQHDFCSKECYHQFLRERPKTGVIVTCMQCDKETYKTQSQLKKNNRSFCSKKCHMLYQSERDELHSKNPWTFPNVDPNEKKETKKKNDREYWEKNKEELRIKKNGWIREKKWKEQYPKEFFEVLQIDFKLKKELKKRSK